MRDPNWTPKGLHYNTYNKKEFSSDKKNYLDENNKL